MAEIRRTLGKSIVFREQLVYNLIRIGVLADMAVDVGLKQSINSALKNPQIMEMKIWLTKARQRLKPNSLSN